MRLLSAAAAALALASAALPSHAATQLGEYFTFSGFGTLGAVTTNSDEGQYVREFQPKGATKKASLLVDSNLGLQMTAKANDWLSATVQTLTAQQLQPSITTEVEWAFVKVMPVKALTVRVGKMSLPNFLISDSRRIGYANTWLRPANEVYAQDVLNDGLTGADLSYRLRLGDNALTATGLVGKSGFTFSNKKGNIKVNQVRGLNLLWDGDWYTARLGYVQGRPDFSNFPEYAYFLSPGEVLNDTYTFTGFGFTVDKANVVLQGEYVQRRLKQINPIAGTNAWYLLGGYRIGAYLPYAQFSRVTATPDARDNNAPQDTKALGLRWDAFSSAAIKFQIERVDTKGSFGLSFINKREETPEGTVYFPVSKPVTTFAVALDFVF
jgi:hypothetical protein